VQPVAGEAWQRRSVSATCCRDGSAANAGASFSAVALDGGTLTLYAVAGEGPPIAIRFSATSRRWPRTLPRPASFCALEVCWSMPNVHPHSPCD